MILEYGTKPLNIDFLIEKLKDVSIKSQGEWVRIEIKDKEKSIIKDLKGLGFVEK
tara:strand:+ start:314 stop:478 length:165 start_codon:yes stop_codon:yes gene_type:complete